MKTEHEKLKIICDEMGFGPFTERGQWSDKYKSYVNWDNYEQVDVREIIFTPEFREYLYDYLLLTNDEQRVKQIIEEMMWHLKDPVEYLYNLLLLGN